MAGANLRVNRLLSFLFYKITLICSRQKESPLTWMRQIDIYHDSAAELVAFRSLSGASSAIETDVSDLANSALRSRLGTLSGDHEDLRPLITEL